MPLASYGYIGLATALVALLGLALYTLRQDRRISRQRLDEISASIAPAAPAAVRPAASARPPF